MHIPLPMNGIAGKQPVRIIRPMSSIIHHFAKHDIHPFNAIRTARIFCHYTLDRSCRLRCNSFVSIKIKHPIRADVLQGKIALSCKTVFAHWVKNKSGPRSFCNYFSPVLTAGIHYQNIIRKRSTFYTCLYVFFLIFSQNHNCQSCHCFTFYPNTNHISQVASPSSAMPTAIH